MSSCITVNNRDCEKHSGSVDTVRFYKQLVFKSEAVVGFAFVFFCFIFKPFCQDFLENPK